MAIVRTGMLWPSLIRWLVILIGGSSGGGSTVGACRWGGAGSMYAQGHRRLGASCPTVARVGRCIAVQGEAASKQPVGLGDERRWVRLIARGEAQLVGGGRLVGEAG